MSNLEKNLLANPAGPVSEGANRRLGMVDLVWAPLVLLTGLTLVTGVLYPLVVTLIAQTFFADAATGSLVRDAQGQVRGSEVIGQAFGPGYFWSRPSAISAPTYDGTRSSGSNLGPSNEALHARVAAEVERLRAAHPTEHGPVPLDLVTTSGSGLDPHISPAGARFQLARVASERGVTVVSLRRMVDANTEGRWLGIFGEPRVNVLRLNMALDRSHPPEGDGD